MMRKAIYSWAVLFVCTASVVAQVPRAVVASGESFAARLTSVDAEGRFGFDVAGKARTVAAVDLLSWGQPVEIRKGPIVLLADGGLLTADITRADKASLAAESDLLGALKLPLESLSGIVFRPPPRRDDLDALLDRVLHARGESDRLILDNGDEVTGLIELLDGDKLKVKGNVGLLEVALRRVVAVVFNPALRQKAAGQATATWVGLSDGARLPIARLKLNGDLLKLTTQAGATWKATAKDIVFVMPLAGRAVYLSDIRPSDYRFLPYLDLKWNYQADRNVTGGLLRCSDRLYLKGIGVHSAAGLTYELDRPWSRFEAETGIDDSTAGRGSVGFRVFVDGKQTYASGPVRGGEAPRHVSVDLTGAKRLNLLVDYGEAGDVMDHADWLEARLVK